MERNEPNSTKRRGKGSMSRPTATIAAKTNSKMPKQRPRRGGGPPQRARFPGRASALSPPGCRSARLPSDRPGRPSFSAGRPSTPAPTDLAPLAARETAPPRPPPKGQSGCAAHESRPTAEGDALGAPPEGQSGCRAHESRPAAENNAFGVLGLTTDQPCLGRDDRRHAESP